MNIDWRSLNLKNIPRIPGVYAFKLGDKWLYIGKSINLRVRLNTQHVPLQTALELYYPDLTLLYCWADPLDQLENELIEKFKPEWNGHTERGTKYPSCKLDWRNTVPDEILREEKIQASLVLDRLFRFF